MRARRHQHYALACDDGDRIHLHLTDLSICMFHVERIAYGSVMIRVETWTGEIQRLRLWPGDQAEVSNGNSKHLAAIVHVESVDGGRAMLRAWSPQIEAGGIRIRLRGIRLGQSTIRRVPDPGRMIPVPLEQTRDTV